MARLRPEGFLSEDYSPALAEEAAKEAADGSDTLTYDQELSDAVGRFQERYGIVVDGLLGPETLGAMNLSAGERRRIDLPEEIPVYLLYWTARASEDGTVHFRKDLYGHDGELAGALSSG